MFLEDLRKLAYQLNAADSSVCKKIISKINWSTLPTSSSQADIDEKNQNYSYSFELVSDFRLPYLDIEDDEEHDRIYNDFQKSFSEAECSKLLEEKLRKHFSSFDPEVEWSTQPTYSGKFKTYQYILDLADPTIKIEGDIDSDNKIYFWCEITGSADGGAIIDFLL